MKTDQKYYFQEDKLLYLVENTKYFSKIINLVIKIFPEHKSSIKKSFYKFEKNNLEIIEYISKFICDIAKENLSEIVEDYKWLCKEMMVYQFLFKKNKGYRFKSNQEIFTKIYFEKDYMTRYLNGLLISQIIWSNHYLSTINFFNLKDLLTKNSTFLEIGPGHGLYLAIASKILNFSKLEGWDISETSLLKTKANLQSISILEDDNFKLKKIDINKAINIKYRDFFDLIVISEVLECVENPSLVLKNIYELISLNGLLYLNFPINSPAPDNIYLLENIENVEQLLIKNKFQVISRYEFPSMGLNLKDAQISKSSISCVMVASKKI